MTPRVITRGANPFAGGCSTPRITLNSSQALSMAISHDPSVAWSPRNLNPAGILGTQTAAFAPARPKTQKRGSDTRSGGLNTMCASRIRSLWPNLRVKLEAAHTVSTKRRSFPPSGFAQAVRLYTPDGRTDLMARPGAIEVEELLVAEVEKYLNSLKYFEKLGVPKSAGTDSEEGFDLRRMSRLLSTLGDPLSKYQVVHVAGTKGKGLNGCLHKQHSTWLVFEWDHIQGGLCFDGPHIRTIRERIVSGETGQPSSAEAFSQLFKDLQGNVNEVVVAESGALTHFEVVTALAFSQFAREKVDIAVIETGLGGARDATNVIPASSLLASVIVGVGKEHLEALGGSLESIAHAKAGIIKEGRPVILGRQAENVAEKILRQVAASKNAPVVPQVAHEAVCELKGIVADYRSLHPYSDILVNH